MHFGIQVLEKFNNFPTVRNRHVNPMTKNEAHHDITNTLRFSMDIRYHSLTENSQCGKTARCILCNFVPLYYGPNPAGIIRKKYV